MAGDGMRAARQRRPHGETIRESTHVICGGSRYTSLPSICPSLIPPPLSLCIHLALPQATYDAPVVRPLLLLLLVECSPARQPVLLKSSMLL